MMKSALLAVELITTTKKKPFNLIMAYQFHSLSDVDYTCKVGLQFILTLLLHDSLIHNIPTKKSNIKLLI